ncbi:kinase-like protein [Auricularia subglabra TFB-10046 SS5]|nr:kinase-like protein [Auricularia subglabra TFB-10046 SS5]
MSSPLESTTAQGNRVSIDELPSRFFLKEELVQTEKRPITIGSFGNVEFRLQKGHRSPLVAVKIMRYSGEDQIDDRSERLLAQELAPLLAACNHRNIAEFRGLKRLENRTLGIVIACAEKGSLLAYLSAKTPHNEIARSQIISDIMAGLEYLHTPRSVAGYADNFLIVHGDLHPGNVLLESDGRAVLTDFGLCKLVASGFPLDLTAASSSGRAGVAPYIAPELHAIIPLPEDNEQPFRYAESRSTITDIFALGMLIFATKGGRTASLGPTGYAITAALNQGTRPTLSVVTPKLDDKTCKIIEACWHHEATRRPSISKVRADLAAPGTKA